MRWFISGRRVLELILISAVCMWGAPLQAETAFLALQKRVTEIYEQYSQAVVRVKAFHVDPPEQADDKNQISVRIGSGFFISKEGLLLVNASRVKGAERVVIEHEGTDYLANILGMDEQINVALLKAEFLPDDFEFIRMNDNPVLPAPGTLAVSISCPFTFSPTPRLTMVAGHDTKFLRLPFPTTYLRVDQSLHKGEGGGPIIDLQGRLVGMLLASIQETEASYALPARAINKVKDDLLLEGRVVYASVGIEVGQQFIRGGQSRVTVLNVVPESPAAGAGMQKDDVILRVGEYPIGDFSDFPNAMFFVRVGEFVNMEVERDGEVIELNMKAVARTDQEPFVRIEPLTREEAISLGDQTAEEAAAADEAPANAEAGETAQQIKEPQLDPEAIPDAFSVDKDKPGPELGTDGKTSGS